MTCRLANVLKLQCGVKKGDRVIIYMPTTPMAVAAMLACARIGAVHWLVTYESFYTTCPLLMYIFSVLYSVLGVKDLDYRIRACKKQTVNIYQSDSVRGVKGNYMGSLNMVMNHSNQDIQLPVFP